MQIGSLFDTNFFKNTLKIPENYIKGFQYYCIEDAEFVTILQSRNKTKIEFLLIPWSLKYIVNISTSK